MWINRNASSTTEHRRKMNASHVIVACHLARVWESMYVIILWKSVIQTGNRSKHYDHGRRKLRPASRRTEPKRWSIAADPQIRNVIRLVKKLKFASRSRVFCYSTTSGFPKWLPGRNKARRISGELILPLRGPLLSASAHTLNLLEDRKHRDGGTPGPPLEPGAPRGVALLFTLTLTP